MNELSLFTGAGGGIWGTKLLGWRTIGYVENEPYCQKDIQARIREGYFDDAPIFGDIHAFIHRKCGHAHDYRGQVAVLTAGFPCQPFSVAGKRLGEADGRNLWPQTIRCIRIVRPRYAFLENSPALLANPYFGTILGDLAKAGYDAEWCVLGADDVGAPHRRKRLWVLAHAQHGGRGEGGEATGRTEGVAPDRLREDGTAEVANTNGGRLEKRQELDGQAEQDSTDGDSRGGYPGGCDLETRWWDIDPADLPDADSERLQAGQSGRGDGIQGSREKNDGSEIASGCDRTRSNRRGTEPRMGRVAHGMADRVQRLRALGNGQVPFVVATAWRLLSEGSK